MASLLEVLRNQQLLSPVTSDLCDKVDSYQPTGLLRVTLQVYVQCLYIRTCTVYDPAPPTHVNGTSAREAF